MKRLVYPVLSITMLGMAAATPSVASPSAETDEPAIVAHSGLAALELERIADCEYVLSLLQDAIEAPWTNVPGTNDRAVSVKIGDYRAAWRNTLINESDRRGENYRGVRSPLERTRVFRTEALGSYQLYLDALKSEVRTCVEIDYAYESFREGA